MISHFDKPRPDAEWYWRPLPPAEGNGGPVNESAIASWAVWARGLGY